jgi:hypothetical protein
MKNNVLFALCVSIFALLSSCNRTANEPIPTGPVNITIDLNLADYQALIVPGNFVYLEGGVKGVLVIHDYEDNWHAFERTCAWEPLSTCSKIWVDTAGIQLQCGNPSASGFVKCCESQYYFNGFPSKGPARGSLARYRVSRIGNLLQVYN